MFLPPNQNICPLNEPFVRNDLGLEYPLGGHNYYNNRDIEKLLRRMRWFNGKKSGEVDWGQYGNWLREEEAI
jgi:hypothetical protein